MHEPVSFPSRSAWPESAGAFFQMPPTLRRTLKGAILGLVLLNALLVLLPLPRDTPQNSPPTSVPGSRSKPAFHTVTDEHRQIALTIASDWENVTPPFQQAILTLHNGRNDLAILVYAASTPEANQPRPTLADYNALAIKLFLQSTPKSAWVRSERIRIGTFAAVENEFELESDEGSFFMLQTVIETPTTFYQLQSIGHAESAKAEKHILHEVIRTFRTTNVPPTPTQENP